ncbi:hypothetical protein LF817_17285 [Halobacillus sp. A1]|uniref:hypothetical protein n=1 Tax=Halobacillus sp. A1 TaxID=2880262 RepID=UPI0020A669A8|nr:hypothetical protein [Halobacillus sp. A1]MCP3033081.1 hypothetical protein [Halobacillus sp. A1]
MNIFSEFLSWPVFTILLVLHAALLFFKKKEAVLHLARGMIALGAAAMVIGLFYFLQLGVYGVLLLLVGLVFYIFTKDHMEKG